MYEFLLVFGVVLWMVVIAIYGRKPVASMYHPLTYYILIHGLIFVIRPIFAYYYDFDGLYKLYEFMPLIEEKSTVLACADLGFITFAISSLKFGNVPLQLKSVSQAEYMTSKAIRSFLIACLICLPFGAYSLFSILIGTSGEMAMDMGTGISYNIDGNGYFSDAQLMVGPICVVFAWVFRFKIWSLIPFIVYLIAKASTGGRGPFVQAFLALCILYFYSNRKKWPTIKVAVPIIGIFILFSAIGSNRQIIRDVIMGNEITAYSSASDRPLESMDYANMEFFEYVVHVIPKKSGTYGYFLDNLQIFTEPVPRVLWRNKPLGAPIKMYDLYAYGFPIGMTYSIPGEGWAQGGWIGVLLWSGLFGAFYGWIYNLFAKGQQNVYQVAIYVTFLAASIITFRDGVLVTILKTSLFNILPFLVWALISRGYRNKHSF